MREAVEAVYALWAAAATTLDSGSALSFTMENEPAPEGAIGTSWARVAVRHLISKQQTLGQSPTRQFMRRAVLTVQVFTPAGGGVGAALDLAHAVRAVFEGLTSGGITFGEVTPRELGTDGHWFQTNVDAVFTYYETK